VIVGMGLDLVEIDRMKESLERHGMAFAERILHPDEDAARVGTGEGAAHLAGLFAAKEAVMKALGTGMAGAAFKDIAILNRPNGEPYVRLSGRAQETAKKRGIRDWRLSITHSRTMAAAVAIALE
jgi:holo-[acyl-carrier protein] synthase